MTVKKCSKCGETKPLSEYYKDKKELRGIRSKCKVCLDAEMQIAYEKNKDRLKATTAAWAKKNKQYRRKYLEMYRFKKAVLAGKIPRWTKYRSRIGLVPPKDQPWPDKEYLERARHIIPGKKEQEEYDRKMNHEQRNLKEQK